MINLGNKIRELRKKKGITQEQLASALNLSVQAISKCETGAGYPDVATLPVIASYFGVSLDVLFDYDANNIEEKITEILYSSRGGVPFDIAEKRLIEGIAAYPSADILKKELLMRYEMQMRYHGCPELQEPALAIAKKLIAESNDYFIVSSAKNDMASILIMNGNYEEAKAIIESMPYVYNIDIYDRMRCSSYMLTGEDRLKGAREFKVWAHQDLFSCCEDEGLGFWEVGDYENAILSFEEVVNGIEVFAHRKVPEEYTLLKHYVYQAVACVKIAACHYKLGRLKESDDALDKAYSFLKNGYSEEMWNNNNDFCMKFYREPYHEFGLDEYKPCI
ncbi:MAG: helix-turn-helix domain-containing protein [Clostridia bacterium]|nr:helix-turn-helix domain-containing protein [Clostridia bacterium]